jgi:hypothetical protein
MSDVNFVQLVEHITKSENQWGHKQLSIWGGTCRPDQVEAMLEKWGLPNDGGMSCCIWETSESIGFEPCPDAETTLERTRIFGVDGDLSLRRHADHFLWYFVGKQGIKPPKLDDGTDFSVPDNDFWQKERDAIFLREQEQTLLWGERKPKQKRWYDDRVGWAKLTYPIEVAEDSPTRPYLHYQTFSRAGQVEFVWYLRMEAS